jgi:hypothetical protein
MKELILGMLSIGMVSCYVASSAYCGLNLWFNHAIIDSDKRSALIFFLAASVVMVVCGTNWIINSDYMKIPTWQALGWGIMHVCLPLSSFYTNNSICKRSSLIKCDAIRDKILNEFKSPNHSHRHVSQGRFLLVQAK